MSVGIAVSERSAGVPWRPGYRVAHTGHRIVVSTPQADPELWAAYEAGATETYRRHGVQGVLRFEEAETDLFFLALHGDEAVGGMRSQGPLRTAEGTQAFGVWDGDERMRAAIERCLPDGLVESKGLWVRAGVPDRRALVEAFARAPLHASATLGARYAMGAGAEHTAAMWAATGALPMPGVPTVAYPDERYRTTLIVWDRWSWPPAVAESEKRALDEETAQLIGPVVPAPRAA